MLSERRLGLIWVLMGAAGYAFLPVFTRMIYSMSALEPTDIAIWRFAFATPIIWFVVISRERWQVPKRKASQAPLPIGRLLPMGAFYAVAALCAFVGLRYIQASLFIVLFYTYPAMVAILSLFLGSRLSFVGWIALALTLIGILLTLPNLSGLNRNAILGISIALLNGLVVAVYFIVVARVMKGIASIGRGTAWIITGTLLTLLLAIPFYGLQVPSDPQTWLVLTGLAAISTAMPIFFVNMGIQLIGAPQTAIISAAEPVMSMLLAVTLIGETVLPLHWLGALLIVGGVVLLEARPMGRKPVPKAVS
ncbi:MAG: DMT family transporter [Anaerolineae bacterium]|nr:DMT family transporter [Anaerolineae bacterium]